MLCNTNRTFLHFENLEFEKWTLVSLLEPWQSRLFQIFAKTFWEMDICFRTLAIILVSDFLEMDASFRTLAVMLVSDFCENFEFEKWTLVLEC